MFLIKKHQILGITAGPWDSWLEPLVHALRSTEVRPGLKKNAAYKFSVLVKVSGIATTRLHSIFHQ
jgi:hypothetical protein